MMNMDVLICMDKHVKIKSSLPVASEFSVELSTMVAAKDGDVSLLDFLVSGFVAVDQPLISKKGKTIKAH